MRRGRRSRAEKTPVLWKENRGSERAGGSPGHLFLQRKVITSPQVFRFSFFTAALIQMKRIKVKRCWKWIEKRQKSVVRSKDREAARLSGQCKHWAVPVFFQQSPLSERFQFNWFLFKQIHCWNASNERGQGGVSRRSWRRRMDLGRGGLRTVHLLTSNN